MNPVEQIKGIKDVKRLAQLIVQRSYSKNEDIDLLQNNGYDEDCATAYMDGYVDGWLDGAGKLMMTLKMLSSFYGCFH